MRNDPRLETALRTLGVAWGATAVAEAAIHLASLVPTEPEARVSGRTIDPAEKWAQRFHDLYEEFAVQHGARSNLAAPVVWGELPRNRRIHLLRIFDQLLREGLPEKPATAAEGLSLSRTAGNTVRTLSGETGHVSDADAAYDPEEFSDCGEICKVQNQHSMSFRCAHGPTIGIQELAGWPTEVAEVSEKQQTGTAFYGLPEGQPE